MGKPLHAGAAAPDAFLGTLHIGWLTLPCSKKKGLAEQRGLWCFKPLNNSTGQINGQ
jgi:hypothetical protein